MYGDNVTYRKRGSEIKAAIALRCTALQARLQFRNGALDEFMANRAKLRSYLILSVERRYDMHEGSGELRSQDEISSEEIEDINQLCRRIHDIEADLYRLKLVASHMQDDAEFDLSLAELVGYGFQPLA